MNTYCTPLAANLFLFCYERYYMLPPNQNQAGNLVAFNSTSKYPDDLLNIYNAYFEQIVSQIYPTGRQLNKTPSFAMEASFVDLTITNDIFSSIIYDK